VRAGAIGVLSSAPPRAADRRELEHRLGAQLLLIDQAGGDSAAELPSTGAALGIVSVAPHRSDEAVQLVVAALGARGVWVSSDEASS
jgi:hypothetical protein